MNYKKVKLGDENNIPQSIWSTDDNVLCENNKTLKENITNINEKINNGEIGATLKSIEPGMQDIPKLSFVGNISTMSKTNEVILQFNYVSQTANNYGYASMKWQGSSSLSYSKKNYTIKLYEDSEKTKKLKLNLRDWGEQNKFVLKANYIDTLHVRNIVCARLAGDIMKNRSDFSSLPTQLQTAPNNGYVDGFPVEVFINGSYMGLYTMNIPKDKWCYNLDESDPNNCLLMAERNGSDQLGAPCEFRANATIFADTSTEQYPAYDWVIEVGNSEGEISDALRTSFNDLINVVKDTTDEEFKAQLPTKLDLNGALNYYIFVYLLCDVDGLAKNMGMVTYDGNKWYPILYDMDSTFGSNINGTSFNDYNLTCPGGYQDTGSLLWQRIEKCFAQELYNRYVELRNSTLSLGNIFGRVEEFCDVISDKKYTRDRAKWTNLPSADTNTIDRLETFMINRAKYVDSKFETFNSNSVACTNITLNSNTLTFTNNNTQTLTTTLTPTDTTDNVIWSVSPSNIVTVDNDGVVTPIANGTCTITATCGSKSATCNVTVTGIQEESGGDIVLTKGKGFINNDGTIRDNENCYALEEYYEIKPSTTYTITCKGTWINVFEYDESKNLVKKLSNGGSSATTATITTTTSKYLRWGCYGGDDGTTTIVEQ